MTSSNNLDALFADGELPFGHPGRWFDGTPEYFNRSPLMNQEPERDYMPDGDDTRVHYAPGDHPLCGTESMTADYTDDPALVAGCADCLELAAEDLVETTSTGRTASTASKRSPPGTASSGGASSVRPARTAGSPDGAGLPKHPVDAFIHLSAKLIIGPSFPVLSSAPSTDYYKGPGIIHGAPGFTIHVAPRSNCLASQVPQLLPDSVFVTRFDRPL